MRYQPETVYSLIKNLLDICTALWLHIFSYCKVSTNHLYCPFISSWSWRKVAGRVQDPHPKRKQNRQIRRRRRMKRKKSEEEIKYKAVKLNDPFNYRRITSYRQAYYNHTLQISSQWKYVRLNLTKLEKRSIGLSSKCWTSQNPTGQKKNTAHRNQQINSWTCSCPSRTHNKAPVSVQKCHNCKGQWL